jgi:ubiquitin-like modifier-activating enzyme ATG7
MSDDKIFQYFPFKSHVHPSFWHKLAELKIDVDGLSDKEKNIFGYYTNVNTKNCLMQTDYSAFNSDFNIPRDSFKSHGLLLNKNTIEEFKNCSKKEILEQASIKFWQNIQNGNCIKDPSLLVFFLILSFADLKKYNYYYWFAFPVCSEPVVYKCSDPAFVNTAISATHLELLNKEYFAQKSNTSFFILETTDNGIKINALEDKISATDKEANFRDANLETTFFCFADPCEFVNAGWVLRNFVAFLVHWCPKLRSKKIKVMSVRIAKASLIESSLIYEIIMPETDIDVSNMKWIGWERNEQGNYGPKLAAMANTMDPIKQAENSVNLNLKLMKWRLLPNLDLEIIAKTRCLLIGAGTLGCGVARSLLVS